MASGANAFCEASIAPSEVGYGDQRRDHVEAHVIQSRDAPQITDSLVHDWRSVEGGHCDC